MPIKTTTRAELIEQFRSLNRKLKRNVKNIVEVGSEADQTAARHYQDLIMEGKIPKRVSTLTDKELSTLIGQLKYIDSLKSSTLSGAKRTKKQWREAVVDKLDFENNKDLEDKFFDLLSRATEQPHQQEYKYQIAEIITDILLDNPDVDIEDFMSQLDEAFKNATLKTKRTGAISGTKLSNEFNEIRTRFRK